jgi:hypothetical protein
LLGDVLAHAVTIDTGGYFKIGSGTKDVDLTGIQIDDTEIVGQNNGVDQVVIGADGKLKAGQGSTVLDGDGITLHSTTNYEDNKAALTHKYNGDTFYRIVGQSGYIVYNMVNDIPGLGLPPTYRQWIINNLNPGAGYDLLIADGNSAYKHGTGRLRLDFTGTAKSMDLSSKFYDQSNGAYEESKLSYYANSPRTSGNSVVLSSASRYDNVEDPFVASIALTTDTDESNVVITADNVSVVGTLGASNISATPTANHIPKADALGKLDAGWMPDLKNTYVDLLSAQTVAGVKTFSSIPVLPASDPTTGDQAARKAYVDGKTVFLTTPLTSTSWDGDARSTTAKTLIDLSAVFGVPAGVKAVLVKVALRDSGSAGGLYTFQLSGVSSGTNYSLSETASEINDRFTYGQGIVPCDANGDIYYALTASGTNTMDVWLEIWGYWL